jgi:hypothetical protein
MAPGKGGDDKDNPLHFSGLDFVSERTIKDIIISGQGLANVKGCDPVSR